MDTKLAGRIFAEGVIRAEHSGKDTHREHINAVEGRPWIFPGEKIIEYDGKLYAVKMPEEIQRR